MRKTVITLTAALALLLPASAAADAGWVVTPSSVDFGSQVAGTTATARLEVTNALSHAMTLFTISMVNPAGFGAGFGSCNGVSIQPGASCLVTVSFTPPGP